MKLRCIGARRSLRGRSRRRWRIIDGVTKRCVIVLVVVAILLSVSHASHAGYTHYWTWKTVPASPELEATLAEMNMVAVAKQSILTGFEEDDAEVPRFRGTCSWGDGGADTACILFNGIGDAQHETFAFPLAPFTNNPEFSFVKTAYKPYDVVVAACLIVARDHFPEESLHIGSDGTWPENFTAGGKLYTQVLGRAAHNPLSTRGLSTSPNTSPNDGPVPPGDPGAVRKRWLVFSLFVAVVIGVLLVFRRPR